MPKANSRVSKRFVGSRTTAAHAPQFLQAQKQNRGTDPRKPEEKLAVHHALGRPRDLDQGDQQDRRERRESDEPLALELGEVVVAGVARRRPAEVEPAVKPAIGEQREVVPRRVRRQTADAKQIRNRPTSSARRRIAPRTSRRRRSSRLMSSRKNLIRLRAPVTCPLTLGERRIEREATSATPFSRKIAGRYQAAELLSNGSRHPASTQREPRATVRAVLDKPHFVVPVAELTSAPRRMRWEISDDWLRWALTDTDALPRNSPGELGVELTMNGKQVIVRGQAQVAVSMPCVRTLDPVDLELAPEIFSDARAAPGENQPISAENPLTLAPKPPARKRKAERPELARNADAQPGRRRRRQLRGRTGHFGPVRPGVPPARASHVADANDLA